MRRPRWLALCLALTLTPALASAVEPTRPEPAAGPRALGRGPAYETLGRIALLHEGRVKPLDTVAREEVRQIHGRETVKVVDAEKGNQVVETWGPVAALYDWSVRPEVWDERPVILVDYLPLKRLVLAGSIRSRLEPIAGRDSLSAAARDAVKALVDNPEISSEAVKAALALGPFDEADRKTLSTIAAELSEDHKWLTPLQLEDARIQAGADTVVSFSEWFESAAMKKRRADGGNGEVRVTDVERRGVEVGTRLLHYQALRDRSMRSVEPMRIMPRPSGKEYLAFLAKSYDSFHKTGRVDDLTSFELDSMKALDTYWNELATDERAIPGTDPKFDEPFTAWLRTSSAWVPLKALVDAKPGVLAGAGYPSERVDAFLKALAELDDAEGEHPGEVEEAKARALVDAARSLGASVNPSGYPTVAAIERETYFNRSSPFWKAQWAYVAATLLLGACLGFMGFARRTALGGFGRLLYLAGLAGLVVGVLLECQGFYYRVRISGWAPVTNMYETVIWVSLFAAVLGLVFEGIYRRVFAALSGAGVALLGTVLAANVPLLDPNIHQLQPVLRSNYWLTIHVITEVSSYSAFLMAAILGLIASLYYLTATYRRSPSLGQLVLPLVPGLPLLAAGAAGIAASQGRFGAEWVTGDLPFYLACVLAGAGGMLTIMGVGAVAGELVNRATFREVPSVSEAAVGREERAPAMAGAVAAAAVGSTTSTHVHKPTAAEIRERSAGVPVKLDARGQAMRETAAKIKPLSNFIYRTMQVGVLLIAAGTILGGVWADYSWGRFWGWDPKEVWALITLLIYLIPLHGRFAGWINTFSLVVLSVFCSMSVIMAWYGVNFVLGVGLHSYGFTEGGGQGVVMAVCLAVLAVPLAAGWRRFLGSRVAPATTA